MGWVEGVLRACGLCFGDWGLRVGVSLNPEPSVAGQENEVGGGEYSSLKLEAGTAWGSCCQEKVQAWIRILAENLESNFSTPHL